MTCAWTFSSVEPLGTSSFIIAYIHLIVHIIFSIIMLRAIAAVNNSGKVEERRIAEMLTVQFVITQLQFVRMVVFSVVLLVGLREIKRNLVSMYLTTAAIFLLLDCNMFFLDVVHGHSAETALLRVTVLSLEAYSFLVVRGIYNEMEPTHINA